RPAPGAELRRVARAGGGAALGRRRLEDVGGAVVGDAVAALRRVAGARRWAAHRRALHIRRTGDTRPRARLGQVTHARRRPTHRARGLLGVGRAARARAVAALGRVAGARRRPAHRARVARRVLARIAAAVALIERARIAVVGARGP